MLTSKKDLLLRILFIFSLLNIPQYNYPTFPPDFSINAYQSYIIACVTSCCVGILLCAFFQHCNKPTLVPTEKKHREVQNQLLQELKTKLDNTEKKVDLIEQRIVNIANLLSTHNNNMEKIIADHQSNLQIRKAELALRIKTLRVKEKTFLKLSNELQQLSPFTTLFRYFKIKNAAYENDEKPLNIAQT